MRHATRQMQTCMRLSRQGQSILRLRNCITPIHLSSTSIRHSSGPAESYEVFTERYRQFFTEAEDTFEVARGLNNCFAYDLVPSPVVIEAALRAARRVNDFSLATRVFEALRIKVENQKQYDEYMQQLKSVKDELGVLTKEELYHP